MKKFYSTVAIAPEADGFAVLLDERPIKTPDKHALRLPTETLAEAVAGEWRAQEDEVDPSSMPMTRLVNTALDRVAPRKDEVVAELLAYAHTDLVCYRADEPAELVAEQANIWQPYLDWLAKTIGVELKVTSGIVPLTQDESAINRLRQEIGVFDAFTLTAFHAFVAGFGSIVVALALVRGFKDFETCWQASLLDESHQEALWGLDAEVEDKRNRLKAEMQASLDLWHFAGT